MRFHVIVTVSFHAGSCKNILVSANEDPVHCHLSTVFPCPDFVHGRISSSETTTQSILPLTVLEK